MSRNRSLLSRLMRTAALSSVVTALLVTYQWSHAAASRTVTVTTASPEMMSLLRDEHGLVAAMLEAHLATEKKERATDSAARSGATVGASLR
jgi:H+/gluconate symporter-like permease